MGRDAHAAIPTFSQWEKEFWFGHPGTTQVSAVGTGILPASRKVAPA